MMWGLTIYISLIFLSGIFIFVKRRVKCRYYNVFTYKYSTDYERLKQLLDDGVKVIRIYEDKNDVLEKTTLMYKTCYQHVKNTYYVDYKGLPEDVEEEKFFNYCAYNGVKYLEPYSIQKGENKVKNSLVCEEN